MTFSQAFRIKDLAEVVNLKVFKFTRFMLEFREWQKGLDAHQN